MSPSGARYSTMTAPRILTSTEGNTAGVCQAELKEAEAAKEVNAAKEAKAKEAKTKKAKAKEAQAGKEAEVANEMEAKVVLRRIGTRGHIRR